MSDNVLIIGYGRAGKRHAAQAAKLGLDVYVYDPFLFPNRIEDDGYFATTTGRPSPHNDLSEDLQWVIGDGEGYAVVCTPPKDHLWQIELCLEAGMKVLCEKPLCDIGQLAAAYTMFPNPTALPVMVAYNYRYHPKLVETKGQFNLDPVKMVCEQYRPELPEWGLLLDHCSHDLDIMRMVTGKMLVVDCAHYDEYENKYFVNDGPPGFETFKSWTIHLSGNTISETVTDNPKAPRRATIESGFRKIIEIDPDPRMFDDMWAAFLRDDYENSLSESMRTQQLIEKCFELNEQE